MAGSSCGEDAIELPTAIVALVHFTAEYCAPAWCGSTHTCLIDKPINDALRIVTKCLRATPMDNLFIFEGIQPTELYRQKVELSWARRAQEPEYLLYKKAPVFTR